MSSNSSRTISERYEEVISTLNTLQSNQTAIKSTDQRGKISMQNIISNLSFLNVKLNDIDQLNIIHIAGTKGKGSTCAFTESILRQYGYKTGFFSSPHLIEVRERIRINGELISKEKFIEYFWICYNTIHNAIQQSLDKEQTQMPFYFAFLTTMMFYVFIREKVDVAIVEVGIGGEYDCTNIIQRPTVCAITSLGLDHIKILGNTIEQIAWQKSGIFKKNVPAVTAPQVSEAMNVLVERAKEKECPLIVAPPLNNYSNYPFQLSLDGHIQEINASVAIQLVFHWLHVQGVQSYDKLVESPLSKEILQGLATCRWSGRNEIFDTDTATYYLDGAHTVESIEQCQKWFVHSLSKQSTKRKILLFYCSNDRQPEALLPPLMQCEFDCVVFCSPLASSAVIDKTSDKDPKPANDQWRASVNFSGELGRLSSHVDAFEKLWLSTTKTQSLMPSIHCFHTIPQAIDWINDTKSSKPSVLVTGSLYLVGAVLKSLTVNNDQQ